MERKFPSFYNIFLDEGAFKTVYKDEIGTLIIEFNQDTDSFCYAEFFTDTRDFITGEYQRKYLMYKGKFSNKIEYKILKQIIRTNQSFITPKIIDYLMENGAESAYKEYYEDETFSLHDYLLDDKFSYPCGPHKSIDIDLRTLYRDFLEMPR